MIDRILIDLSIKLWELNLLIVDVSKFSLIASAGKLLAAWLSDGRGI
jgi:hypothetical protein